jgi:hypothetical protein
MAGEVVVHPEVSLGGWEGECLCPYMQTTVSTCKVRRGTIASWLGMESESGLGERRSGITASNDRPRLASHHIDTPTLRLSSTTDVTQPSSATPLSDRHLVHPRTPNNHSPAHADPRDPIPTSDKAAQPATMKPVVSAFNAWTWYVASTLEENTPGKYARAGETKTVQLD